MWAELGPPVGLSSVAFYMPSTFTEHSRCKGIMLDI